MSASADSRVHATILTVFMRLPGVHPSEKESCMLQQIPGFRFLMVIDEAPSPAPGAPSTPTPGFSRGVYHLDGQDQNLTIVTPSGASKRQLHRLIHLVLEICVGLKPETKLASVELGRSARVHIMSQLRKRCTHGTGEQVTMVHLDSLHLRPHHSEELLEVFGTCTMASARGGGQASVRAQPAALGRSVHAFTATLSPQPQSMSGWALLSFRVF